MIDNKISKHDSQKKITNKVPRKITNKIFKNKF